MSSTHLLVLLSVVLTVGVVLVLAVALIEVRTRLERISDGLEKLESALSMGALHLDSSAVKKCSLMYEA